jgi:hypothetical protein
MTRLSADQRRALYLLASNPRGCTEESIVAHGLTLDVLIGLVRDGLAHASRERMQADGLEIEITCVRITGAGRRALAG